MGFSSRSKLFAGSLLMLWCLSMHAQEKTSRKEFNFNSDWKVHYGDLKAAEKAEFDDGTWKKVTIPYAFNQKEAYTKSIDELTTGISWYRKTFNQQRVACSRNVCSCLDE